MSKKENKASNGTKSAQGHALEGSVPYLEVPCDDDDWRFARSFAPAGEEEAACAFFEEHGFAVFHGVLTPAEAAESRREILGWIAAHTPGFAPDDEATWSAFKSKQFGMPPPDETAWWQPQLSRNRRNPAVASGFAQLLRCAPEQLRCNHDRWALYRRGASTRRNLHLDIDPALFAHDPATVAARRRRIPYAAPSDLFGGLETNLISAACGPHLQGTLALADNEVEDAGFLCVPGSHRHFEQWAHGLAREATDKAAADAAGAADAGRGARHDFPAHSPLYQLAQRVAVRAGSLIVWDVRLAHGSAPDVTARGGGCGGGDGGGGARCRPRFVQFVTLRSQHCWEGEAAARRGALVRRLYAAHGLAEPDDAVERAVAGLADARY